MRDFFDEDFFNRKAALILILFQFLGLVVAFVLLLVGLETVALVVSVITLVALLLFIFLVRRKYKKVPIVQEKYILQQRAFDAHNHIRLEENNVQEAKQKRKDFIQDEQREIQKNLLELQQKYMRNGLQNARIEDALIPGIGPKLITRLAGFNIITALDVNEHSPEVPGIGNAKRQALLAWREGQFRKIDANKPTILPDEQLASIREKYKGLNEGNDENESRALASKYSYEGSLREIQQGLREFADLRFGRYLNKSLHSRGYVAVITAVLVLGMQVFSCVGSTTGAVIASIPTATFTATPTLTPTFTLTPTSSSTPSLTLTPTITLAPTITSTVTPLPAAIIGATCIPANLAETGRVVAVTDGDTIRVILDGDGNSYAVRYIGIDSPETNQGQQFADQATIANSNLVFGKNVTLIKDVSETDQFGRLLRYVLVDGSFVNYELVANGFARALKYPPDVACSQIFLDAEQQAATALLGLWGVPVRIATVPLSLPTSEVTASCSCSGNLYNCSDFSSHANAQACYNYCISQGRGDIHKLDGDNNGSACESLP